MSLTPPCAPREFPFALQTRGLSPSLRRFNRRGRDVDPAAGASAPIERSAHTGNCWYQLGAVIRAPAAGNGRQPFAQRTRRSHADGPKLGRRHRRPFGVAGTRRPCGRSVGPTPGFGPHHHQRAPHAVASTRGSDHGARRRPPPAHASRTSSAGQVPCALERRDGRCRRTRNHALRGRR